MTLCTCKHQMRASCHVVDWPGMWLAGLTSRCIYGRRHWLFYLTRIDSAYESPAELWSELSTSTQSAKSAQDNFLGDVFVPRGTAEGDARFQPRRYLAPARHAHRRNKCDGSWYNDVNYKHFHRFGRPALLVGDPNLTFLWQRPMICYDRDHGRNYAKWDSVSDLIDHLETVGREQ